MKRTALPKLFSAKMECCGCSACIAVCPKDAITMQPDDEGFDYPFINPEICIRCYRCLTVCPFKEESSRL